MSKTSQERKSFSDMTLTEFQSSYVKAVNREKSDVGGNGFIEEDLWWKVSAHQKWASRHQVDLPDYESIEQTQENWV
jgi:hypothetical protein